MNVDKIKKEINNIKLKELVAIKNDEREAGHLERMKFCDKFC